MKARYQLNTSKIPNYIYKLYDSYNLLKNFVFKRYPIKNSNSKISCDPFFIIGSGRSGNTLLRAILTSHSDISIPPESYVLGSMVRKYQSLNFLNWEELVKVIIGELEAHPQFSTWEISLDPIYKRLLSLDSNKRTLANIIDLIYCFYSEQKFPGFKIWGDKTPLNTLNLKWIDKVFSKAKYIHIIRDGRDVVCSYKKANLYNIEEASCRWNKSIELSRSFGKSKSPDRYMEVRYEDLVRNPENEIKSICEFLQIEYNVNMLNFQRNFNKLGDTKLPHHGNLKNKINVTSIGKWKGQLNEEERVNIENMLHKNLKLLGYK
ncbi:sulfotransferase family protein [Oceanobacillus salinisoli]|uniref:sulfotransferase family protein n=1 Tax=Oceanobacillus salinisoli TaxID=2678611 RepID=UPI0018CC5C7B|nr:sulfotransferase [Oceanobacillus salinisoli]